MSGGVTFKRVRNAQGNGNGFERDSAEYEIIVQPAVR